MKLDAFDHRIITELTFDARIPFVKLAQKLNVSNTFIHQRIKKLLDSKILKQAKFGIDPEVLGYETSAYTQVMLADSKLISEVIGKLRTIPEIVECVNISGRYALMVKIFCANNTDLRNVIYYKIQAIEGVSSTNTTFCFETSFRRQVPLPALK